MYSTLTLNQAPSVAPPAAQAIGRGRLTLIALTGAATAAVRGLHHNFHLGTLLIDPYWINFYLTSFQDGFRRRAVVGSVVRWLSPHAADVRLLNLAALLTAALLAVAFAYALVRICVRPVAWSTIFLFSLCASAFLSVYFEVLGDLLQVTFVLFFAAALLPLPGRHAGRWKLALLIAAMGLGVAIHEAALFFLAPTIPFLLHRWPRLRDFIVPVAAAACLLALSMHWSADAGKLTYSMKQYPHAVLLTEPIGAGAYGSHLQEEYRFGLIDTHARVFFATRILGSILLSFASLVALANCVSTRSLARILYMLSWQSLFSIPLWFIAHDWGRFLGYNLLLAVVVTPFNKAADVRSDRIQHLEASFERFALWLKDLADTDLIRLAGLMLLLISPFGSNRHLVLRRPDAECAVLVLALGFATRKKGPALAAAPVALPSGYSLYRPPAQATS